MKGRIGVCSWSLEPSSPGDLARKVRACGLDGVQLALEPLRTGAWRPADLDRELDAAGVAVLSGMVAMRGEDYTTIASIRATGGVRPDADWPSNLAAARESAAIARDLGIGLVSFHAGFIPEHQDDPLREVMLDRVRELVDAFAEANVRVALETGQESAGGMLRALLDLRRPGAGVNFDPANMILYGTGDPVEAFDLLHEWVRQIHVKDARRAQVAGAWGQEVPAGTGEVDWKALFAIAAMRGVACDRVVEREAGGSRVDDVRRAAALVRTLGRKPA
jgi:sugar phosphate isomerase/epimerase